MKQSVFKRVLYILALLACGASMAYATASSESFTLPALDSKVLEKPEEKTPSAKQDKPDDGSVLSEQPASSKTSPPESIDLDEPVDSEKLGSVDPDTLGLLSANEGGLGASMWEGAPRALVDKLLSDLVLPTFSPTLNSLARRLLLSTAAVPSGESSMPISLTSLRVNKLLELGDVSEAWKLAMLAKPKNMDATTMRLVTEAAMIGPDSKALCDHIADFMVKNDASEDWQKALVLCQLRAGDLKAVQLSLDVMREQKFKDDMFIFLVNRAVEGTKKRLPRQLTPLRPLTMGVLRQLDLPLPSSIYSHPDAALIPEMLLAKAESNQARLGLAEKSAALGVINAAQLGAVYMSTPISLEDLAKALTSDESGVRLHALLYQAASKETDPQKRASLIARFVQSASPGLLNGSGGQALAELASEVPIKSEFSAFSVTGARLFALSGKPDKALLWLKIAQDAAAKTPDIQNELIANWPLFVLGGIITDSEYNKGMKIWLDSLVKNGPADSSVAREQRRKAGNILTLFSAAGFAVPEEAWMQVMEGSMEPKRRLMPSPVLLERLRNASVSNHRGETVLLSLLVANGEPGDMPVSVMAEAVRGLRLVGLSADSLALAREAATSE